MPKKHVPKELATKEKYVERLVAGLSPANKEPVQRFLKEKAALTGIAHAQGIMVALSKLDRFLNGAPIQKASADQLRDFLDAGMGRYSPTTVHGDAVRLRIYLKWFHDVDELPRPIKKALRRPAPPRVQNRQPVTDEEFTGLLRVANQGLWAHKRLQWQAMIWTLWDSGFRLGELLSLRVGAVELDGKGGARLRLRPGDLGLKTRDRTIYVVDCVPALKAWLGFHPAPGDADAYLFPCRVARPHDPYWAQNINALLRQLCVQAEIRHVHPHLFRHTSATRKARAGWNEAQLRAYFGWSATSPMPSIYVHLAQADMETRVRQDAGIDETGRRAITDVKNDDLSEAFRRALEKVLKGKD